MTRWRCTGAFRAVGFVFEERNARHSAQTGALLMLGKWWRSHGNCRSGSGVRVSLSLVEKTLRLSLTALHYTRAGWTEQWSRPRLAARPLMNNDRYTQIIMMETGRRSPLVNATSHQPYWGKQTKHKDMLFLHVFRKCQTQSYRSLSKSMGRKSELEWEESETWSVL